MEIFSVAINAFGTIVCIAPDLCDVEKWVNDNGRNVDCVLFSFCSLSEYYEWCKDNGYKVAI